MKNSSMKIGLDNLLHHFTAKPESDMTGRFQKLEQKPQ